MPCLIIWLYRFSTKYPLRPANGNLKINLQKETFCSRGNILRHLNGLTVRIFVIVSQSHPTHFTLLIVVWKGSAKLVFNNYKQSYGSQWDDGWKCTDSIAKHEG